MTREKRYPPALAGLHAALATPYDADGAIAPACLERLIDFILGQGIDGLYVGGSTGEALLQSTEEREQVLHLAAEAAQGRGVLIGQVGSVGTREAQRLAKLCASAGYHAVSAIPPIYFQHSKAGILSYYQDIAEAADGLPVIVYNIPKLSGVQFSLGDLEALLAIPGVVGMKQTSIDMYQMEQLHRLHPEKLLLNGFDEMLLAGIASGANGGVGSTYNIMGARYVELLRRFRAGDNAGALEMQGRCNAVLDALVTHGVFPSLKYLLYRMKIIATPVCRAPLDRIDGAAARALDAIAAELSAEAQLA
ncbi:N-acetylneuraminate lyase [Novosphingobium flavum]|uniref:N-acetylneuraminate lyase n=1 Tax=Novosphingobium flavum TaxID=1778672 RepID=A0A7X1FTK4_9SPHN|nr:N-acetylneuraminate lyase [Novosphingobium flavum]MBC2666736.1 N-acetylneuraminate lyase [Novosphingobium flavum]